MKGAPIKMYALRPIAQRDVGVRLPDCMYRLKNIHGDGGTANETRPRSSRVESITDQVKRFLKNSKENQLDIVQIANRQKVVLKQLEDLHQQIALIRDKLQPKSMAENTSNAMDMQNLPEDLSLNVNPNNPPYSLLLLMKYWRKEINIKVLTYTHSGIEELPSAAQTFMEMLKNQEIVNDALPTLTIRLIWKELGINQFEMSGSRIIQGEVNFLRYLARLTNALNYEESDLEMDTLLDVCYTLIRSSTKTEKMRLMQRLGKTLGRNQFICGDFSLVDIAAFSAIKQNVTEGVNVTFTKWMRNCEAL